MEHDAAEIWDVTRRVAVEAIVDTGIQGAELDAIGITNQRETVVAWDPETGQPLHNALVRQDRPPRAAVSSAPAAEDLVRERTGLVLDPYFSGTKIEWLLRKLEAVASARCSARSTRGSCSSSPVATQPTWNASRTLLFDIRQPPLGPRPARTARGRPGQLPEALPSAHVYGTTTEFGGEVPVAGIAGDQRGGPVRPGLPLGGVQGKNTRGTSGFVLLNAGRRRAARQGGLLTTIAWGLADEVDYALEAAIFVTGAAVQWLRDGLGVIGDAAETEALASSLDSNDDVYFVPALTGLGSPYWDPCAPGHDRQPQPAAAA